MRSVIKKFQKKKKKKSTNPFLRSFTLRWAWWWGKWQERKVRREKLSLVGQAQQDGWKFFQALGIRCENSKITSQFPEGDVHALFEMFTKSQWRRNKWIFEFRTEFKRRFQTFKLFEFRVKFEIMKNLLGISELIMINNNETNSIICFYVSWQMDYGYLCIYVKFEYTKTYIMHITCRKS